MAGIIDGIIGGALGAFGALSSNNALKKAMPDPIKLAPYTKAFDDYTAQGGLLPDVAALLGAGADQDNARYLARLEANFPGITDAISQQSAQALNYQQGGISPDKQIQIDRDAAYRAYNGGYARSTMADKQKELATVKQALSNVQIGNQMAQAAAALSDSLSPEKIDVSKTLLTPQDILARTDANAYYNQDLMNQEKALRAGVDLSNMNAVGRGVAQGLGSIGSMLSGGQNQWSNLWGSSGLGGFFSPAGQGGGASVPGGFAGAFGNIFG